MAVDRGMTEAEDPKKTDAVQAEARGDRPYEPERDDPESPLDRARDALQSFTGGRDYQDHGVSEPEL